MVARSEQTKEHDPRSSLHFTLLNRRSLRSDLHYMWAINYEGGLREMFVTFEVS